MRRKIFYFVCALVAVLGNSCSDDFTVKDQGSTFSDTKIEELAKFPESALALTEGVEAGAYNSMIKFGISNSTLHEDFGQKAIDIMMDAMGTDMVFPSSNWFVYHYNYQGRTENTRADLNYNYYAKLAHNANLIIKFLRTSNPDYLRTSSYGRALVIRALANFYQIRLLAYDNLGIAYETDELNEEGRFIARYERVPTNEVYEFIERDLLNAYAVLEGFLSSDKNIIDQRVVSGFLSRLYLELKDWTKAKDYALKALEGNLDAVDFNVLNTGFSTINNIEVMWGAAIDGGKSTSYASFFSHMDSTNEGYGAYNTTPKMIDERLYAQIDQKDRRIKWFYNGTDFLISPSTGDTLQGIMPRLANLKFIDPSFFTGDYIYMRKSEMLLNYAEAAAESNDNNGAHKALNALMESRLENYSAEAFTGQALVDEVRLQRRIELWGEGFGLLDIKRWGIGLDRSSSVVVHGETIESSHKYVPGTDFNLDANSNMLRFQFPIDEINANQKLRPQNP